MSPDEHAALLAAREGDDEAGRRLVASHAASMLRTAWTVLGRYGGTEAEDVVQEALVAALTTLALPDGDVGAWLRAITARKALDAVRRTTTLRQESWDGQSADPATTSVPADVLAVRSALARLSPGDRAVLVLVELEGLTMQEAAAALGTSAMAVRWRAVRARRRLRAVLDA